MREEKLREALVILARETDKLSRKYFEEGDVELALALRNIVPDLLRYYSSRIGKSDYIEFMSKCLAGTRGSIGDVQARFRACAEKWKEQSSQAPQKRA